MFTGLIQDVGHIRRVERQGELLKLSIETLLPTEDFCMGESVSVDGICLTVVGVGKKLFAVEASPETLERTTLRQVRAGREVNLERALRLADRLGGHWVTGHVDGVGSLLRREAGPRFLDIDVRVPTSLGRYLVEKGSVSVDGISLTVNRCGRDWFGITVIPHTLERTTLVGKGVGDPVNVECDILGKYVEKMLGGLRSGEGSDAGGVTKDLLRDHGFLP